jgi:hypothetical protein
VDGSMQMLVVVAAVALDVVVSTEETDVDMDSVDSSPISMSTVVGRLCWVLSLSVLIVAIDEVEVVAVGLFVGCKRDIRSESVVGVTVVVVSWCCCGEGADSTST